MRQISPKRLRRSAAEKAFTSFTGALGANDIDVVVVCTPTSAHAEVASEALPAGKHVIIGKPAELNLANADAYESGRAGKPVSLV
jgi:UDP-N-acetyl-2-amino-2-deoxyglucuronate dehydrogenase